MRAVAAPAPGGRGLLCRAIVFGRLEHMVIERHSLRWRWEDFGYLVAGADFADPCLCALFSRAANWLGAALSCAFQGMENVGRDSGHCCLHRQLGVFSIPTICKITQTIEETIKPTHRSWPSSSQPPSRYRSLPPPNLSPAPHASTPDHYRPKTSTIHCRHLSIFPQESLARYRPS